MSNIIEVGYGEALQFGVEQGTYIRIGSRDEIEALHAENKALKQQVEQGKRDAVPEDIRKDAERWRAIVAEAERDYVEVPSHEEPYWQRLECTEAMEEWADAAIAAALKEK